MVTRWLRLLACLPPPCLLLAAALVTRQTDMLVVFSPSLAAACCCGCRWVPAVYIQPTSRTLNPQTQCCCNDDGHMTMMHVTDATAPPVSSTASMHVD